MICMPNLAPKLNELPASTNKQGKLEMGMCESMHGSCLLSQI